MGTKNDYWTKAVAEQGLSAFDQRRQQNPYDSTQWQQAINFVASNPYAVTSPTEGYQQWQQQSNMLNPTGYALSYGRTSGGKYAGYKTESDMWNALEGTALMQQQEDRARADAMSQLLNDRLDKIQSDYTKNTHFIPDAGDHWGMAQNWINHAQPEDLHPGSARANMPREKRQDAITAPWMQLSDQDVERNKMMNLWLAQASGPLLDVQDTMTQIKQTPYHDYKVQAGAMLGIDPMLVQGRYDPQTQVADLMTNRNLQAWNNYGTTYGDYTAALNRIQSDAEQQAKSDAKQQDQNVIDYISQVTGYDGAQLARDNGITPQQALEIVGSTQYAQLKPLIEDAVNSNDFGILESYLAPLRIQDPRLYAWLNNEYADPLAAMGWDPATAGPTSG